MRSLRAAGYSRIGIVSNPKLSAPLHTELAICLSYTDARPPRVRRNRVNPSSVRAGPPQQSTESEHSSGTAGFLRIPHHDHLEISLIMRTGCLLSPSTDASGALPKPPSRAGKLITKATRSLSFRSTPPLAFITIYGSRWAAL